MLSELILKAMSFPPLQGSHSGLWLTPAGKEKDLTWTLQQLDWYIEEVHCGKLQMTCCT